tara:strand:- start:189 stop:308 length:120 start_codon:yes stop_codon:yes gene_type:complete
MWTRHFLANKDGQGENDFPLEDMTVLLDYTFDINDKSST